MRRGWTKRKNGHEETVKVPQPRGFIKMKMTKGTVIELAKEGARRRLQDIEREANTLRIFLGEVPQAPGVRK
jgi:hypothetical protein